MNELQAFLESEVIEAYCFGIATPQQQAQLMSYCAKYPEVRAELELTQMAIGSMTASAKEPTPESILIIKKNIRENQKLTKATLSNGDNLAEFFQISRHTPPNVLADLVQHLQPAAEFDNIFGINLYQDSEKELTLLWSKEGVPEEVHEDVDERFLLLEGPANCHVGKEIFSMEAGDFMKIPLHTNHWVVITSEQPAKAIVTRVKVA